MAIWYRIRAGGCNTSVRGLDDAVVGIVVVIADEVRYAALREQVAQQLRLHFALEARDADCSVGGHGGRSCFRLMPLGVRSGYFFSF